MNKNIILAEIAEPNYYFGAFGKVEGSAESFPYNIHGENLQEIADNMLEILNESDNSNKDYEIEEIKQDKYGEIEVIILGTHEVNGETVGEEVKIFATPEDEDEE